jgi:hypothetical protein
MLTRSAAMLLAASFLITGFPTPATAVGQPADCEYIPGTGRVCTVTADSPATPGSSASDQSSSGKGATSDKKRTCQFQGRQIDCDPPDPGLWWSNDRQCWVGLADPQPPKDDPVWEGNTDGVILQCRRPGSGIGVTSSLFWAPTPPPSPAGVNPAKLADRAVERMELRSPVIAMTPMDPAAPLLVGMDAWLWLADDGPASVGPITRTASADGVTVSATAEVSKVVWDMGDGQRVTCTGPGTPWTPSRGTGPSPTCGHRYVRPSIGQPGGTFPIRATAHWRVHWSGAGQSGVITFTLSGERALEVTELQVLQTG